MRSLVHQKYGGRCAYCGAEITIKQMQVDHLRPKMRGMESYLKLAGLQKREGIDDIENLMPSCGPCNRWKATYSLNEFRTELTARVERLRRDSAAFRMAERHGLVAATGNPVVFWFEKIGK